MRFGTRGEMRAAFEMKFTSEGTGEFEGYGAVFEVVDYYRDTILRGAFAETLAAHAEAGTMPRMLWFHDPAQPCGEWTAMREDERGLFCAGRLDLDSGAGLKAYGQMKQDGSLDLSIGYTAMLFEIDRQAELRRLKKVWLDEVSLAPRGNGVNPAATVTGFKAADRVRTIRDFEDFLRDAGGFSRDRAKAIASRGFRAAEPEPRDGAGGKAELHAGIDRLLSILKH